ncbi:MAG TPA: hypothetical protein PKA88_09950 [Polyangiaceae bacterium]|nr:hypothetical protein [Polyangiaceae bacterium]
MTRRRKPRPSRTAARVLLCAPTALGIVLLAAPAGAGEKAKPERPVIPSFEAGGKFGVAVVGGCEGCDSRKVGTALALDLVWPLGSRFGLGMGVDYVDVAYSRPSIGGETDHVTTVALLLRPVPLRAGKTIGYVDLAAGPNNHSVGAFAGLALEYALVPQLRAGPYARFVWKDDAGVRECSGLGDCTTYPPYTHAWVFGLGVTAMAL